MNTRKQTIDVVSNILDCVASLEATQNILKDIIQTDRYELSSTELAFTRLSINQAASKINTNGSALVPSVESDNYFESNLVVSVEAEIGKAIVNGVKAAYEKVMKFIKFLYAKLTEYGSKLKNKLKSKIADLKAKVTAFKEKIKKTPKETLVTAAKESNSAPEGEGIEIQTRFGG